MHPQDSHPLVVTAIAGLALALIVAVLLLRCHRVTIRELELRLGEVQDGVQAVADKHLPDLFESVGHRGSFSIPQVDTVPTAHWVGRLGALLDEASRRAAEQHALDARKASDAEARERTTAEAAANLQRAHEANQSSLINLICWRLPDLLAAASGKRYQIPPPALNQIPAWCARIDRLLLRDAEAAVTERLLNVRKAYDTSQSHLGTTITLAKQLQREVELQEYELRHLVETRLPSVMDPTGGAGVADPGLRDPQFEGSVFAAHLDQILTVVAGADEQAEQRADDQARAIVQAIMRSVRAGVSRSETALSEMQRVHDDPVVLDGLLRIDHTNSQLLRRIQAVALLCGATSGTQWPDTPMEDVLRGALSRIQDNQRIDIGSRVDSLLIGPKVEQAVMALAELIDNAARYSVVTPVHVAMHPTHNGVTITIDDGGIGMTADEMARANAVLSGDRRVRLQSLGDPPKVGLAVCAELVRRNDFRIYVDNESPHGGVRATLFLPLSLLKPAATTRPDRPQIAGAPAPRYGRAVPASAMSTEHTNLPVRRRGARARPPAPPTTSAPRHERTPDDWSRSSTALSGLQRTPGEGPVDTEDTEGNQS